MVPETEEYGISSFVYRCRRPFVPTKLHKLVNSNFFTQERPDTNGGPQAADGGVTGGVERSWRMEPDQVDQTTEPEQINQTTEPEYQEKSEEDTMTIARARALGPFGNVLRSKGFMWLATRPHNMGLWSQAGAILVISNSGPWVKNVTPKKFPDEFSEEDLSLIGDKRNEIVFIGTFTDKDRV